MTVAVGTEVGVDEIVYVAVGVGVSVGVGVAVGGFGVRVGLLLTCHFVFRLKRSPSSTIPSLLMSWGIGVGVGS